MRLIKPTRLLWTVALLGGLAGPVYATIPVSERVVLDHLYQQTNGESWSRDDNWGGASGTECSWFGVFCNSDQTHVIGLSLAENHLAGNLPADLAGLTNLTVLDVHSNALTGSIPALTGLTNLTGFYANSNQLTGSIPPLTGLTNLLEFAVSDNLLIGPIPDLAGLTSLGGFYASSNQLTGSIPDLADTNMVIFDVASNALNGPIPALDGLTNLTIFDVSSNALNGPIPALADLTNLTIFDVASNALNGPIPALTGLTNLTDFSAGNNQLDGSIPVLTGLTRLTTFYVPSNQLRGSIPELTGLTNLTKFAVYSNQLTGSIPALAGLPSLTYFWAFSNQLRGSIPALNSLTNLSEFYVGSNELTGSIPVLEGLANLTYFDVNSNQLIGPIPALDGLTQLKSIDVGHNRLTGSVPAPADPASFIEGYSSLCPNPLDLSPSANDAFWNFATGIMPWWSDGHGHCDAVEADAQFLTTAQDVPLAITLTATDPDGHPLDYFILTPPNQGGELTGTPPNVTYSPAPGFNGIETFTFKASDGTVDSNVATVTITVGNGGTGNQDPVADAQIVTTAQDVPLALTLTATDPDGDSLAYAIVAQPSQGGQLSGTPPNVTYTPAPGFNGIETFTFKVNDGTVDSNVATVTITVGNGGAGNQAPVANAQDRTTAQDESLAITLTATDPDGDSLDYAIVAQPNQGGQLTGTPPNVTYSPAPGFNGIETFTFKANDGALDSNVATVTITVGNDRIFADDFDDDGL